MMKRVGVVVSLCLALAACDPPLPGLKREPVAAKPAPAKRVAAPREAYAVPPEERPVLGKIGDTTCATADTEQLLEKDATGCATLLKDTIKVDTAAESTQLKLARVRVAYYQPGPEMKGEIVGWALYATRTHCSTGELNVMGGVLYRADGVEITRATPVGGRLSLPEVVSVEKLRKAVCAQ